MIWFKHFTDNHRGRSMQFLFDEMGHAGIACWYILMEMCAEKLEKSSSKEDCVFEFHERILRDNLRLSRTNVRRMLDQCATFAMLQYEIDGTFVKIKMPKLAELLHRDLKVARQRPGKSAAAPLLDTDKELDKEKDPPPPPKETRGASDVEKFESRFKNHENPDREKFREVMRDFVSRTDSRLKGFQTERHIDQAMLAFANPSRFFDYLDSLAQTWKAQRPDNAQAYFKTSWRENVLDRAGDVELAPVVAEGGR